MNENLIKKILFIQSVPCIRTNKVAKALNNRGIQVDMLYLVAHPSIVYKNLKLPYKNIYQLKDVNEMIDFINNSDYDILYSSNEPDYLTVLFTATNKPIVHDTHDMMSLRSDITNEEIILEYIANVKSSGNIYVNPMIRDIAVSKFNLKDKPILTLHSFIEEEQLTSKYYEKLSKKDGEIHCVFEGGLYGTKGHHRYLEPIFLKLAENNIHVHLHCPVDENYIKQLVRKSEYIHYEGVTSPENLITEMTKYDIGLAIFNLTERNKIFLDTAFPNKIWDYLAAGLPIMFADLLSFRRFSEESKVGKVLNLEGNIIEQFKDLLNIKIDKNFLKDNKWTMNEAADDIIKFLVQVKNNYYNNSSRMNIVNTRKYSNIINDIRKTYNEFKLSSIEKIMLIGDFNSIEKDIENFNSSIINGVCVVDREVQYKNYKMVDLNSVNTINYDYIIIDTEDDLISNEIKNKLINLRVLENKIVLWKNIILGLLNIEGFHCKLKNYIKGNNFEAIITGLSYAESGIDTSYLKKPTFNFALSGQDMYYDYKILKYIFEKRINIENLKYVIMNLAYYSFGYDLSKGNNKYRVQRYYNILKDTHNNRSINEVRLLSKIYLKCENSLEYENYCKMAFNCTIDKNLIDSMLNEIKKQSNMMYQETIKENKDIFEKILILLSYHNVKPILVILPVTKEYQNAYDYRQRDAFYSILNSFKDRYSFQVKDYFENGDFEDDEFHDFSHLNLKGAKKFTILFNEYLNKK